MVQMEERYKSSIRSEYTGAGSSPACRTKIERQNIMEEQATYNRKRKYDVVIGIDPDVERSGCATLSLYDEVKLTINSHPFPELLEIVRSVAFEGEELGHATVVYVEAGWLNRSNWHLSPKDTRACEAKKGEHVGRNHATGCKLDE